ncbi:MAG: RnfABCDGE type electron transport complex subunit D [Bacteroidales bacterium]|nr:RnfABCDGE type electron transport complex subunit D [Bacteroidales bacterium]MBQ9653165.1 RnfABCDGE type electron transport complex subunit D [Bacteroidales bacterium]
MSTLTVSPSPHIHSKDSTMSLMRDVVIALVPAVICSFVFYGWREILLMLVSVASCVCLEWAVTKYMLKQPSTIGDLSAVVTGILLGLNLPYSTPLWVVFIGAVVAICVAKLTFGGIGQNIWNPALVGRVFLLVSFPTYMTTWGAPQGVVDAVSGPTPLGAIQEGLMQGASVQDIMAEHGYSYSSMLFANLGGSAGEVCALALLAGFVYLCVRKVIKPWITLSIFATVAVTALIFWGINPARFTDPLFNLLSGGLILGACFMATDYVTSPMSVWGGVVFGIGIGFLTMMIRYFGSYPEGVSFAILIMNSVVPLLNMWFKQKKFGRK